jgi:WD40 repeat protein
VAAGSYQAAKVFDLKTGQELITLPNHGGWVRVAFSPDGQHLSTVDSASKAVQVWDATTGKARVTLRGHASLLTAQAYSPDGRRLASSDFRGVVKLWDVLGAPEALDLSTGPPANQVQQIAFSSRSNRVAAVVQGPVANVWDALTGRLLFRQRAPQGLFVALSPDGRSLTAGGEDQTIQIWDVDTAKQSLVCGGHPEVKAVIYNPDGTRLASGSRDGTVKVWEAANGEELLSLQGKHQITDLAFSPDSRRLAATTNGGTVSVWDVATGQELFTRLIQGLHALCVTFSPDGRRLALGTKDGMVRIWDAATGHELHTFAGHGGPIRGVAFSPDGARLALAVFDGSAILLDAVHWREALMLRAHSDRCTGVGFSPDGSRLATGGYDGLVKIWNGLPVTPVAHPLPRLQRAAAPATARPQR